MRARARIFLVRGLQGLGTPGLVYCDSDTTTLSGLVANSPLSGELFSLIGFIPVVGPFLPFGLSCSPSGRMCQGTSWEILTHSLSRGQAIRYRLYKYHDDGMSDGEQELAHARASGGFTDAAAEDVSNIDNFI
uniref:Uncharacterized protein n=1 Tax=Timema bartmani TaxID=61472 RepID=A0A7R9ERS8_9NEOP|nr:unnamed protein product [Timema bartmani]